MKNLKIKIDFNLSARMLAQFYAQGSGLDQSLKLLAQDKSLTGEEIAERAERFLVKVKNEEILKHAENAIYSYGVEAFDEFPLLTNVLTPVMAKRFKLEGR